MLSVQCPHCDKKLKVKEELAGKKLKCPGCGGAVSVAADAAKAPPAKTIAPAAAERTQAPGRGKTPAPRDDDNEPTVPPRDRPVPPTVPVVGADGENEDQPTVPPDVDSSSGRTKTSPGRTSRPTGPKGLQQTHGAFAGAEQETQDGDVGADHDDEEKPWDFLAPPQQPDEIGRLGHYRILKVLGAGGMGVVFKAEDPKLKRLVAIKAMLPSMAGSGAAKKRFFREAQSAAALKHDNIVAIHQVDEDRGAPYIAMEFLKGEPLDERLKREKKLPPADVLHIGREVAEGLAAAHAENMIHRDIKPANVWLETRVGQAASLSRSGITSSDKSKKGTAEGTGKAACPTEYRCKILDFGLARSVADETALTQTGAVVGTPQYMAPEQAGGSKKIDHRCDLFSLGAMLYRMVTGELPFKGDDTISILSALALDNPPEPSTLDKKIPTGLSNLIMHLLSKKPDDRPQSAQEVAGALSELEDDLGGDTAGSNKGKRKLLGKPARLASRRKLWIAAVTTTVAVVVLGVILMLRSPGEGTVTVETVDPDVEITVQAGGKTFTIYDAKTKDSITLPIGAYQAALRTAKPGLVLETNTFTLKNGDRVLVKVRWDKDKGDGVAVNFGKQERPEWLPKEVVGVLGTHRLIQEYPASSGIGFALSKDGKFLVTFASYYKAPMLLSDGKTLQALRYIGNQPGWLHHVELSPDARKLVWAAASNGNGAGVQDLETGKETVFQEHLKASVLRACFVSGGNQVVSAGSDGKVFRWEAQSGKVLHQYPELEGPAIIAISSDGRYILGAAGRRGQTAPEKKDYGIRLWNLQDGSVVKSLKGHFASQIYHLAFSPDGTRAYSVGWDNTLRTWNVMTGLEEDKAMKLPTGGFGFAISPDGKNMAYSHEKGVAFIDLAAKRIFRSISGGGVSVAYYPDNRHVVTNYGRTVRIWDSEQGSEKDPFVGHVQSVQSIAFTANGKHLLSRDQNELRLWDLAQGKELRRAQPNGGDTVKVFLSQDGREAITTGTGSGDLQIWDVESLREIRRHKGAYTWAAWSPDKQFIAACAAGKTICMDATSGKELWSQAGGHTIFRPNNEKQLLISNPTRLVDGDSGKELRGFKNATCQLFSISSDGKTAFGAQTDLIISWDLDKADAEPTRLPKWHTGTIRSLAIAPNGLVLASAGTDGRVILWDIAGPSPGKKIQEWNFNELKGNPIPFRANQVAFSPDSKLLATANSNGTIYLLRVPEPTQAAGP